MKNNIKHDWQPPKTPRPKKLTRDFFDRPVIAVARQLLGKGVVFAGELGIITETEAYSGKNDAACHAARGKTPRNAVMFGPPGHAYVYFIYGVYHCLNFVAEREGCASAVLIRGLYLPRQGLHLNGPGKICRHFGIDRRHSGLDIVKGPEFRLYDLGLTPKYIKTPRIGIRQALDKNWRFIVTSMT